MIVKLLGDPDKTARNPHYRSAAPMKLYLVKRVESVEVSGRFVRHEPDTKRNRAAAKAVKTKVRKITEWAEHVRIEYDFPASSELGGSDRQKVNYLRHECTSYDYTLDDTYGATGKDNAHKIIKNRILAEISRQFPCLAEEAKRQSVRPDEGST